MLCKQHKKNVSKNNHKILTLIIVLELLSLPFFFLFEKTKTY